MRSVIIADECQTKEEKRLLFAVLRLRVLDGAYGTVGAGEA